MYHKPACQQTGFITNLPAGKQGYTKFGENLLSETLCYPLSNLVLKKLN